MTRCRWPRRQGATTLEVPAGRARQMNAGAEASSGEISGLPACGHDPSAELRRPGATPAGISRRGGGSLSAGYRGMSAKSPLGSRREPIGDPGGSDSLMETRLYLCGPAFFSDLGGYADLPIMEDYDLVRRLNRRGRVILAPEAVVTSARRWEQLGVVRTTLLNQVMVTGHLLGVSPQKMAQLYRRTAAFPPAAE